MHVSTDPEVIGLEKAGDAKAELAPVARVDGDAILVLVLVARREEEGHFRVELTEDDGEVDGSSADGVEPDPSQGLAGERHVDVDEE